MIIRLAEKADWTQIWQMCKPVFRAGETYAYSPDISEKQAKTVWLEKPKQTYVASQDDVLLGTYFIKANHESLAAHICNCGYIVASQARGMGVATKMCEHSQKTAVKLGFRAMQYNLVVATNTGAINLWTKLGFYTVGSLRNAFNSPKHGYIDALVMYKELIETR